MPEPKNLIIDITSAHQPGMVYVMLSRVCSIEQLHIFGWLWSFPWP